MNKITSKFLLVLATLALVSPAAAQWQVPMHSVPVGRGAGFSGFKSVVPGASGTILTSNGASADPTFSVFTTIINAACTLAPTPCSYLFGYVRPEWFGASCSTYGTSVGAIFDSSTAIEAAVAWVNSQAVTGGVIQFANCVYKITRVINLTTNGTVLRGTGFAQSTIVHKPFAPSPGINFDAGGAILSNIEISNLSIQGGDTTTTKIALRLVDVSFPIIRNVFIITYGDLGGGLYRGGIGSVGIETNGRETGIVENVEVYAEQPVHISVNPNAPNTGEDMDSWTWNNNLFVSSLTLATHHVILSDAGVAFYNTHFKGHQNWIGGVDGFRWISASSVISDGLYIGGVKDEQAGAVGGYTVNIQLANTSLYNFSMVNNSPAVRNGIFFRAVKANMNLHGIFYDSNTSTTKIGMDVDFTTGGIIDFRGCYWLTGTTATLGTFATSGIVNPTGASVALPGSGVLSK